MEEEDGGEGGGGMVPEDIQVSLSMMEPLRLESLCFNLIFILSVHGGITLSQDNTGLNFVTFPPPPPTPILVSESNGKYRLLYYFLTQIAEPFAEIRSHF